MARRRTSLFYLLFVVGAAVVALLMFYGCGGGSSSVSPKGTLRVAITDKPGDEYAAVVISIKEVRVVPAGLENAGDDDPGLPVIASFSPAKVVDIMQLQFVQQLLGEALLPAGTYNQIRLILEANPNGQGQSPVNYLTLASDATGTRIPLNTPSAQQSGLKINGRITVASGVINSVLIDFDPAFAIVAAGNGGYNFKPQGIRIVQVQNLTDTFGSITGTVLSAFKDWSSATVAVKRRGIPNDSEPIVSGRIFSNYTSGSWQAPFAAFVPASSSEFAYKTFITANGFAAYSSAALPVSQSQATDLGIVQLTGAP